MAYRISRIERVASKINLLEESGLEIESVCTKVKCQQAGCMLKVGYQSRMHIPFLDLVDLSRLIKLNIPQINSTITNTHFSATEIDFLLEARRRYKNRISAEISRNRLNDEIDVLDKEVNQLDNEKRKLSEEREKLRKEIIFYSRALKNTHCTSI